MYASSGQLHGYSDEQLEGFWGAIGGGLKKAGGFVAKQVAPRALSLVPVVGGAASAAYQQIPGITRRAPTPTAPALPRRTLLRRGLRTPTTYQAQPAPSIPWWQRAAQAAIERAREDPALRERAVDYTARYAPPELLAAAGARQARAAPDYLKASTILPALAIAALVLRK